jgi:hypothetical protein
MGQCCRIHTTNMMLRVGFSLSVLALMIRVFARALLAALPGARLYSMLHDLSLIHHICLQPIDIHQRVFI